MSASWTCAGCEHRTAYVGYWPNPGLLRRSISRLRQVSRRESAFPATADLFEAWRYPRTRCITLTPTPTALSDLRDTGAALSGCPYCVLGTGSHFGPPQHLVRGRDGIASLIARTHELATRRAGRTRTPWSGHYQGTRLIGMKSILQRPPRVTECPPVAGVAQVLGPFGTLLQVTRAARPELSQGGVRR